MGCIRTPSYLRGGPQEFLGANGLRLILRSHEGPDARWGREDLPGMKEGFSIDHVTPAGCLMTVFSAPDYPQFQVGFAPPAATQHSRCCQIAQYLGTASRLQRCFIPSVQRAVSARGDMRTGRWAGAVPKLGSSSSADGALLGLAFLCAV